MVQFIGGLIILALICVLANVNLLLATYFGFQWNKQPNTLYYFVGSLVLGAMQFFLILLGCTKLYFFVKNKISGFRFIDLIPNPKIDAYSLRFRNLRGKDLVLKNPFRGIFISGAAGSGKSRSIIEPMIKQAIEKKFTGVMYDFKFPALSEHVYTHAQKQPNLKTYFVNFTDLNRSNRINPIDPNLMNNSSVAREYASAIIQNLNPESIKNKDFWVRSAEAVLTGVFWYLKEEEPRYCTLPHAVALVLNSKAEDLIRKLCENPICAGILSSLSDSLDRGAENQTAGVLGTLKISLSTLNSPEIFWVLSDKDFNLNLNDKSDPKFLCVGNDPSLNSTYGPVISLIITACTRQMNQQGKQHSIVILDEAPTIYIPNFDVLPATARSNKVASVFCAQDFTQIIDKYGDTKAEVILSNLNCHFVGRTTSLKTADKYSKIFGREDKIFESKSESQSSGGTILQNIMGNESSSVSESYQERTRIPVQEFLNLETGRFIGFAPEASHSEFNIKFKDENIKTTPIPVFNDVGSYKVKANFLKIRDEALTIIK